MIDVKKVEDFEKLTNSLNSIATAIENMPTPTGGGIDYTTEEQDTGLKWIDGRKVYQRTFDKRTTALSDRIWNNNILGTSDIEIIDVSAFLNFGNYPPILTINHYRSSIEYISWSLNSTADDINIYPDMSDLGSTLYGGIITIRYVKVGE